MNGGDQDRAAVNHFLVSIDPGIVPHDWTQMSVDRVVRRENDSRMPWFGPKPERLISVRSEVHIFPGPLWNFLPRLALPPGRFLLAGHRR